jgi:hypothetical protein
MDGKEKKKEKERDIGEEVMEK